MDNDDKLISYNEISELEKILKEKRDFVKLIEIHSEALKLNDTQGNILKRLPQMAYCLARLGKKNEANEYLKDLDIRLVDYEPDSAILAKTLVTLFINKNVSEFGHYEFNFLKQSINDPFSSAQFVEIVFDYPDFLKDVVFFSENLLDYVFVAMGRDDSTNIFYNLETNDVQIEVQGYLSSLLEDEIEEDKKLESRIMNFDQKDIIENGKHFLIPRLSLEEFFDKFYEISEDYYELQNFIDEYSESFMEDKNEYENSSNDMYINEVVIDELIDELVNWSSENSFNFETVTKLLLLTKNIIAINYLNYIHSNYKR